MTSSDPEGEAATATELRSAQLGTPAAPFSAAGFTAQSEHSGPLRSGKRKLYPGQQPPDWQWSGEANSPPTSDVKQALLIAFAALCVSMVAAVVITNSGSGTSDKLLTPKPKQSEAGGTTMANSTPNASASLPVEPPPDLEGRYLEMLQSNLGDLRRDGLIHQDVDPRATWWSTISGMSGLAALYNEGAARVFSKDGEAQRQAFKRETGRLQSKAFPQLRALYGKAAKERLWEKDIEVELLGAGNSTIRLTGFWFASNRAIKEVYEAASEDLVGLRFRRIEFRSNQYAGSTYYDLEPLPDATLAIHAYGHWTPVD